MVDKSGKQDKDRGEVLLDIQFMRNNLSASMFDLSMKDKPRSRISKLKDKVRGKKKDGFSDSASAIVPPVSQVLTDSEGEADAQSLNLSPGGKKKSKLKSLFTPKSNLQRNISQSMSTLGTLPEKNSSLSGSRSSGLNVDSPDVKKKFKFLGHKRTGSSDSKVSQGPFSLLSRSKHSNSDLNSVCINGSHVYEDTEPKSGSTLSLNSSGQGSVEDIRKHTSDLPADSFTSVPVPSFRSESLLEQQHHQEEEEKRQAEERRKADARRLEEEERYRAEARRLQEEEERRQQEDEARRKKQREEEEERRRQEEERRMLESAENQRLEEERRKAEEQKRQEEASMSDRLSSLFGMIRKKEEKKEDVAQESGEDHLLHTPAPNDSHQTFSHHSTNPFQDVPLGRNESPVDQSMSSLSPQAPSAMLFLNRSAKVSAVKPRLPESLDSEPTDSPTNPESLESFSNLHSSLAPPIISKSPSVSPRGSTENLSSVGSGSEGSEGFGELSPTMADQRRRAILPPLYSIPEANPDPVREIINPAYIETDKKLSLPLPDYETLFPQKRHGVQGHTKWDHLIAEVNQRHREFPPELLGPEMSVDGPQEQDPRLRSSVSQESPALMLHQTNSPHTKPVSSKKLPAPAPPKHERSISPEPDFRQRQSQNAAHQSLSPTPSVLPTSEKPDPRMLLSSSHAPAPPLRPSSQVAWDRTSSDDEKKTQLTINKDTPTAKPRQRVSGREPTQQEGSAVSSEQTSITSSVSSTDKKESFVGFDPFPSMDLLPKDPWAPSKQSQKVMDPFLTNAQKEQKPEDRGMTTDDLDKIFNQEKTDPFAAFNGSDANKNSPYSLKEDVSKQFSAAFQRKNSQKGRKSLPSPAPSDNKTSLSQPEPAHKEEATLPTANQDLSSRYVTKPSITLQPQADMKTQSSSNGVEDPFGSQPLSVPSARTSSETFPVPTEESGKALMRAWVSPSEVESVSTQNSNGSGLVLSARRPHPVKPLSPAESQYPASTPAVKEIKVRDSTAGKFKVSDSVGSGPYTQLTQEELITLVVKQQTDLSVKEAKIVELEEYIDNLLVRVIEEKPSILNALNSPNPV